jgi:hypothetical protein
VKFAVLQRRHPRVVSDAKLLRDGLATLDASDRQRAIARYQEAVAVPRFAP